VISVSEAIEQLVKKKKIKKKTRALGVGKQVLDTDTDSPVLLFSAI